MYGDDRNMVAIGIKDNIIEVKMVRDGSETILYTTDFENEYPYFKIEVERGRFLSLYFSSDGENWNPANDNALDASYLVRWDRVARPGMIHIGNSDEPAIFKYFEIIHL